MITGSLVRILIAGVFGTTALVGALALALTGSDTPEWLIGVIFTAAGYTFGTVQTNGRDTFRVELPKRNTEGSP